MLTCSKGLFQAMFTGIIEGLGIVKSLEKKGALAILSIKGDNILSDAKQGDSISVNGACLTVISNVAGVLKFDVSEETLKKTDIGSLKSANKVNIERALKTDSRLGGHFVTGHIDCTGKIEHRQSIGDTVKIEFKIAPLFLKYVVSKGSIAVDGISLTVGEVYSNSFAVYLIPHTIANTTLGFKKQADIVNIELDILAKYTEKLVSPKEKESNITSEFLTEHGFI
jgi:riboflavin synthase